MYRARHATETGGLKVRKLVAMVGLAGTLILSLAVPALAGPKSQSNGGRAVYVTDDPCEQQLQQNQIAWGIGAVTVYVNLKMPGDETTDLLFTIYYNGTGPNSQVAQGPHTLTPTDCGTDGNLWYTTIVFTVGPGSYTLEVTYPSGKTFGKDSFLVYVPEA